MVRGLLCKREDLSSEPQKSCTKLDEAAWGCNLGGAETRASSELTGKLSKISKTFCL